MTLNTGVEDFDYQYTMNTRLIFTVLRIKEGELLWEFLRELNLYYLKLIIL